MFRKQTPKIIIDTYAIHNQTMTNRTAVVVAQGIATQAIVTAKLNVITSQKTELIQIMSDYINQRETRVTTVNSLNVLSTKIA